MTAIWQRRSQLCYEVSMGFKDIPYHISENFEAQFRQRLAELSGTSAVIDFDHGMTMLTSLVSTEDAASQLQSDFESVKQQMKGTSQRLLKENSPYVVA
ncbi:hypothetical protein L1D14_07335 [Vibrio tubiashii]|uniref:hypothetical protein n=1 Tax=Vibrio tubiashii TaxID=29498 RepID=UPI001EFC54FD|nr:hypothetical protein [Vibrio tubiashii]MCG9576050.1 hypothetical protein [Vibrio tubiashii]